MSKGLVVSQIVNAHDFDVSTGGSNRTKVIASNSSKSVNSNSYAHDESPLSQCEFRVQVLISLVPKVSVIIARAYQR